MASFLSYREPAADLDCSDDETNITTLSQLLEEEEHQQQRTDNETNTGAAPLTWGLPSFIAASSSTPQSNSTSVSNEIRPFAGAGSGHTAHGGFVGYSWEGEVDTTADAFIFPQPALSENPFLASNPFQGSPPAHPPNPFLAAVPNPARFQIREKVRCPPIQDLELDKMAKEGEKACIVCFEKVPRCAAVPCMHFSFCIECARAICTSGDEEEDFKYVGQVCCPKCKTEVTGISRIFFE